MQGKQAKNFSSCLVQEDGEEKESTPFVSSHVEEGVGEMRAQAQSVKESVPRLLSTGFVVLCDIIPALY